MKFSQLSCYLFTLLTMLFSTASIQAKQLSFVKKDMGDNIEFSYRWNDNSDHEKQMSFQLAKKEIYNRFRQFKRYKNEFSENYVHKKIAQYLREHPLTKVTVTFSQHEGTNELNIQGKKHKDVEEAYQQLATLKQQYQDEFLAKNHYKRFVSFNGIQAIRPDHVLFAAQSVTPLKVLKPLVLNDVNAKNIRKATNFVLDFVQNIPYETLESRITSSGAGFVPPLMLLYQNKGDCDSKVTLTAAILRALMPRINLIIVYIEQHALLGIEVLAEGDDITLIDDGITYVLAEPTGPALLPLGKIAPFSKQAILAKLYSLDKFK